MSFKSWLSTVTQSRRRPIRSLRRVPHRARLDVEALEDRWVPSTITTLASFDGSHGTSSSGLVVDSQGNLYGATQSSTSAPTAFEVAAGSGQITPLATLSPWISSPLATRINGGLTIDHAGNLYGSAYSISPLGTVFGRIFELAAGSGAFTDLADFRGLPGALVLDGNGNLFGAATRSGLSGDDIVFEVVAGSGTVATLASFNGTNGSSPTSSALVMDPAGNLFGTTQAGGAFGGGTVYELAAGSGAVTALASFDSTSTFDKSGLVMGKSGNLFGTYTEYLGHFIGIESRVYEVAATGNTMTTLSALDQRAVGRFSSSALKMDGAGKLFGTTAQSGFSDGGTTQGSMIEVATGTGEVTILATFDGANGANPQGSLVMDNTGNLFGATTQSGASGFGTVFEVAGAGTPIPATSPTVMTVTDAGGTYDGVTAFAATVIVTGSGTITGSPAVDYFDNTTSTDLGSSAPINAGHYTATATYAGDATHTGRSGTVTFDILKAASVVTVTGGTSIYDGDTHTGGSAVVSGVGTGITQKVTWSYTGDQVNAGAYTATATYAGDANHLGSSASATMTITAKLLEATAWSQGTINLGSNGSINLHLAVAAGQLYGSDTVASLFKGATFTIAIQNANGSVTYGKLTSVARVEADGSITVSMQMNDALRADLYDAYTNGRAVNFHMTALANGGDYMIDEDTMSRLLNNGALKYVV
jgi:uncharacterized repeat protein (TIGR03803 family)